MHLMKYNRFWVKCDWFVTDMSKAYRNLNKKTEQMFKKSLTSNIYSDIL